MQEPLTFYKVFTNLIKWHVGIPDNAGCAHMFSFKSEMKRILDNIKLTRILNRKLIWQIKLDYLHVFTIIFLQKLLS